MMRWKKWDRSQGDIPECAIKIRENWFVLQESRIARILDKNGNYASTFAWDDIPIYIEGEK